jgi:hypothetical protein
MERTRGLCSEERRRRSSEAATAVMAARGRQRQQRRAQSGPPLSPFPRLPLSLSLSSALTPLTGRALLGEAAEKAQESEDPLSSS